MINKMFSRTLKKSGFILGLKFSALVSLLGLSPLYAQIPAIPAVPANNISKDTSRGYAAQSAGTATDVNDYLTFGIRFNQTPFLVNQGSLSFAYVDESPSRDNLQISKYWASVSTLNFYEFLIGVGNYKKFHVELGIGYGAKEDFRRFDFLIGVGGNLSFGPKNRVALRYVLPLRYGNARQFIGYLDNNASYIQVNDKQFYSPEVKVFLKQNPFIINPRLDLCLRATNWLSIEIGGGYQFNVATSNSLLRFDGKDGTDDEATAISATEKLNASNVDLEYNGTRLKKMPLNLNGFFLNAGLFFGNLRGF